MLVQYLMLSDLAKELNAFYVVPSAQELTVGDIRKQFPVKANLYLRFKTILQEENPPMAVWLDNLDDFAPAPTFKDQIMVKALFVPPFDLAISVVPKKKIYKESKHSNSKQSAQRKQSDFLVMDDGAHGKHGERSHSAAPPIHENKPHDAKTPTSHELKHNYNQEMRFNPTHEFKFPPTNEVKVTSSHQGHKNYIDPTDGLTTEQLKKRSEDRINQQVEKKTEDVKKMWQEEANMRLEKQDADKEFSDKINAWESRNCQKNNIRTLLATMHNVLWKDSGWEQIGPGDLITAAQVKGAYVKSLNIIHPDKHQKDPPNIKYISERVFSAVNEAFKVFRASS